MIHRTDKITRYLHPTKGWKKGNLRMTKRFPSCCEVKHIDGSKTFVGFGNEKAKKEIK